MELLNFTVKTSLIVRHMYWKMDNLKYMHTLSGVITSDKIMQSVICNYCLPPKVNSGKFVFTSSKSLLEAMHCKDKPLVKPLLFDPTILYLTPLL